MILVFEHGDPDYPPEVYCCITCAGLSGRTNEELSSISYHNRNCDAGREVEIGEEDFEYCVQCGDVLEG